MSSSPVRPYRDFGSWVRSRRLARRWTQEELARRLNYGVTYIRKVEWGERRPSEPLRVRLAQVFGVPLPSLPVSVASMSVGRVPQPASPLVGRLDDLTAVTELFEGGARLVTLVGPPGIGKTRLAVEVAAVFDSRLPGGAAFLSLADVTDVAGVARAIGWSLGVGLGGDADPVERLADGLRTQEMLLTLDNFEHVVDAAETVGELVARTTGVRVLVTSRQALEIPSETQYVVPPLALPNSNDIASGGLAEVASVALFTARAQKVHPDFALNDGNAGVVADICRRLQGIPLAIELAAAIARFLPPDILLRQVGPGLDLPEAGSRGAPAHQRTLRAAIEWSFDLLTPGEEALMSDLSVFAGGCALEAATAVCRDGTQTADYIRGGLLRLASKSLLEATPLRDGSVRFVALDAVREFAAERLRASGEGEGVHARHAAWCLQLVEATEPRLTGLEQAEALAALEYERANLHVALGWAVERDPATALRLCAGLWRFWWIRGHLAEGRSWLEATLAASKEASGNEAVQANARIGAGVLARTQGAYRRAVELFAEGAALSRSIGDGRTLALALINLGIVAEYQGDHDRASDLFMESHSLYDGVGDIRGVGHSLNCLGTVRLGHGDLETASTLFEQSLSMFRALGDEWSVAMVLANLGWIAHKQGKANVACTLYEQGIPIFRALGDDRAVASMLVNLGIARQDSGTKDEVAGVFEEALLTYARLRERLGVVECLEALAGSKGRSDRESAAVLFSAAEVLRDRIAAPLWPDEQRRQRAQIDALRAELGEDFTACWQRGRVLSEDEVVALALRH